MQLIFECDCRHGAGDAAQLDIVFASLVIASVFGNLLHEVGIGRYLFQHLEVIESDACLVRRRTSCRIVCESKLPNDE